MRLAFKREDIFASERVPDFARSVVGASDEPVPTLVECAVCQWQDVSTKDLEQ